MIDDEGYTTIGFGRGFSNIGMWQNSWYWPVMVCGEITSEPKLTGTIASVPKLTASEVLSEPKLQADITGEGSG